MVDRSSNAWMLRPINVMRLGVSTEWTMMTYLIVRKKPRV